MCVWHARARKLKISRVLPTTRGEMAPQEQKHFHRRLGGAPGGPRGGGICPSELLVGGRGRVWGGFRSGTQRH
jgi:hypothetical protein